MIQITSRPISIVDFGQIRILSTRAIWIKFQSNIDYNHSISIIFWLKDQKRPSNCQLFNPKSRFLFKFVIYIWTFYKILTRFYQFRRDDSIWFQKFGLKKSIKSWFEYDFKQNLAGGQLHCMSITGRRSTNHDAVKVMSDSSQWNVCHSYSISVVLMCACHCLKRWQQQKHFFGEGKQHYSQKHNHRRL